MIPRPAEPAGPGSPADRAADTLAGKFSAWTGGLDLHSTAPDDRMALLRGLYRAGRQDLAFARLLEGHVDAIQLLGRTSATETARERTDALVASGASFGVWNADLRDAPLSLNGDQLFGGKAFASGAGLISHALVTLHAGDKERVQLLLIDLAEHPPEIDTSWWNVLGMQASETHLVRWKGAAISENCKIGGPGDYETEPWFSGGALRFVAAQAGGVAAIFDHARDHLVRAGRVEDPHQAARLASLYSCAHQCASVVRDTASAWHDSSIEENLAHVRHARLVVLELGERAILLAQQSVGVQSLFRDHPLSAVLSNLMVYLRQPAPDAQKHAVGLAAADGRLSPDL
ncbi:MAG: acyl-CoA dehydrogenase [Henriciella sp.]|uniref:acyl-CoA dehydrogenase n=1 Tax=Henriciella sp. TaxID=1968823 RepID=UPI003C71B39A